MWRRTAFKIQNKIEKASKPVSKYINIWKTINFQELAGCVKVDHIYFKRNLNTKYSAINLIWKCFYWIKNMTMATTCCTWMTVDGFHWQQLSRMVHEIFQTKRMFQPRQMQRQRTSSQHLLDHVLLKEKPSKNWNTHAFHIKIQKHYGHLREFYITK